MNGSRRLPRPPRPLPAALLGLGLALSASAPLAGQDEKPRSFGILIGVNATLFDSAPGLAFAENDARTLATELEGLGWADPKPVVITNEEATRSRIIGELSRIARIAKPRDSVLVYFAGHGVRDTLVGKHSYWLTYLSTPNNLAVEGIRLSHLLEHVRDIPALQKVVILDHCFSGDIVPGVPAPPVSAGAPGSPGSPGSPGPARAGTALVPGRLVARNLQPNELENEVVTGPSPALALIGAARGSAYEFEDLQHGVFTWALLEALRAGDTDVDRDDAISLDEIWRKTAGLLDAKVREKQIAQSPLQHLEGSVLDWKLFPARQTSGEALLRVVDEIDANQPLSALVRMVCVQAVSNWEERRRQSLDADPKDQRVVEELQSLRAAPASLSWKTKKDTLERLLRSLGLIQ